MSEALIEPLLLDDMAQAALVHRHAFDACLPWLAGLHTPDEDRVYFETVVFAHCSVWGARRTAGLVGFIAFREGWIDHLYVLPGAQGEGVGRKLLRKAQAEQDCLDLWTFQANFRARRFYERNDFVEVERSDGSRNEEKEPDVRYRWVRPAMFS